MEIVMTWFDAHFEEPLFQFISGFFIGVAVLGALYLLRESFKKD